MDDDICLCSSQKKKKKEEEEKTEERRRDLCGSERGSSGSVDPFQVGGREGRYWDCPISQFTKWPRRDASKTIKFGRGHDEILPPLPLA
jgi:hypothetical protein